VSGERRLREFAPLGKRFIRLGRALLLPCTVRDHRSLEAWIEARHISLEALDASRKHWKPYASALFEQFQRAALSVQLNIAEGYALASRKSFANHLRIAYGSAIETQELLELAIAREILPEDMTRVMMKRCSRCQRLLLGLMKRYRPAP
jgi:four helix bundle protein